MKFSEKVFEKMVEDIIKPPQPPKVGDGLRQAIQKRPKFPRLPQLPKV